jgi:dihydropteroate synthase
MILNPYLEYGSKTYIMGILNVTPDSFSGDGLLAQQDTIRAALEQAEAFVEHGAELLDIGGESTRPGAQPVSAAQEMDRVIPVIEAVASSGLNTLISVDTYKADVARAALQAGANWINDVWGLRADPEMAPLAAASGAPVVIMHNRLKSATPELQQRLGGHYVGVQYENLIQDIRGELGQSVALAHAAGVADRQIILDPGIGFGKTVEQNLELVDRLAEIKAMGYPLLIGPSRKSFIGYTLDLPPQERIEGTAAMVVLGIAHGADIVRVHDVEVMTRVVRMTDAVVHRKPE